MNSIASKYDRLAKIYDLIDFLVERLYFTDQRKQIISSLTGKILEIGVGTGKNLAYYSALTKVTAIDISPSMLARAEKRLQKLVNKNIILKKMNAEMLTFSNNSFDYAVATCVFCSVANPIKSLREIRRVLKPNGKAIFLEHVCSKNFIIRSLQDFLNPISNKLIGCNINRQTEKNIKKAGFQIIKNKQIKKNDFWRLFILK